MDEIQIYQYLKGIGCCDRCGLRYLGIKNPMAYENIQEYITKFQQTPNEERASSQLTKDKKPQTVNKDHDFGAVGAKQNGDSVDDPPPKKRKWVICVSCLGILQEETWPQFIKEAKEVLDKKCYKCPTFAAALSAPIATILREKAITLLLQDKFVEYDEKRNVTPLKEAWKWSFAVVLAQEIKKTLDSGAISPLMVTITAEYLDDLEELEPLKKISPALFESRSKQRKRFTISFTRRSVEQALDGVSLEALQRQWPTGLPDTKVAVNSVGLASSHAPLYLGGRYIKLSRELPQTPWVLHGKRMMDSSIQEIIFEPIAKFYGITTEESEHRLKFISAGREDVDVRCLGTGRPFAIEISDPNKEPTTADLQSICDSINKDGRVIIKSLVVVRKDDLAKLKEGEQMKSKTYEALIIKLTHSIRDVDLGPDTPVTVTQADIDALMNYSATIQQKTPIRVLHRRPLLVRPREITIDDASLLPGHQQLFRVRVSTAAGTYVKEWVHGELRRTVPSLGLALGAATDLLALDVASVRHEWPPHYTTDNIS